MTKLETRLLLFVHACNVNSGGNKMNVITVDSGTTNTRATLWKDDCPLYTASRPVGVRMTAIEGNNNALKQAVSQLIQ